MQRLRLTFTRGEEVKYIAHLDLMRLWERALRRVAIPLAYSQGFTPHPRLSLAAPLAVGVTSQGELMDILLERRMSPYVLMKALGPQLPRGIDLVAVQEVGVTVPSLQSLVRFAEYRVVVETGKSLEEAEAALGSFLARPSLPWQHLREGKPRRYDLRALVDDVWLLDGRPGEVTLGMRLRTDDQATGRPEQVALAMGFPQSPKLIHRTKLIVASPETTKQPTRASPERRGR